MHDWHVLYELNHVRETCTRADHLRRMVSFDVGSVVNDRLSYSHQNSKCPHFSEPFAIDSITALLRQGFAETRLNHY